MDIIYWLLVVQHQIWAPKVLFCPHLGLEWQGIKNSRISQAKLFT